MLSWQWFPEVKQFVSSDWAPTAKELQVEKLCRWPMTKSGSRPHHAGWTQTKWLGGWASQTRSKAVWDVLACNNPTTKGKSRLLRLSVTKR